MKRIIVDFSKLSEELKTLFINTYPEGYEPKDIISFRNGQGETIEAIELKTVDAVYLVKVNKKLAPQMEAFSDDALDLIISENRAVNDMDVNHEDAVSFDDQEMEFDLDDIEDDGDDDFFSDTSE